MGHAGNLATDDPHNLLFETPVDPRIRKAVKPDILGSEGTERDERMTLVWRNILLFIPLHTFALFGFYYLFCIKWQTMLFIVYLGFFGGLGITAGAHRLWAHRCYKAKWPLRLWLMLHNTISLQNDIYEWSRDHRVHHKFTDTDADPHNARRGFFFSHMGWLLVRKHPDVLSKGKVIDMSDLEKDPIVMFQKRHYKLMAVTACFVLPTVIPWYFWGENAWYAYCACAALRYTFQLHVTWLVNSAAHMFGTRPFDKFQFPAENIIVSKIGMGEGWHNYHHTFPYDYRASELGWKHNFTCMFLDLMGYVGLAYDFKTVKTETAKMRMLRTGDGSRMETRQHVQIKY